MGGRIEHGVPVGTWSDKYTTRNPIARLLVRGFDQCVRRLLSRVASEVGSILEVGCGEGHTTRLLAETGVPIRAIDWSTQIIEEARSVHAHPLIRFEVHDLRALRAEKDSADLVVALEVLEHMDEPQEAIGRLASLARRWMLLSVPREPLWRLLNLARGRYVGRLGNTPGHVRHWSTRRFARFVQAHAEVVAVLTPLPWTLVLARTPYPPDGRSNAT